MREIVLVGNSKFVEAKRNALMEDGWTLFVALGLSGRWVYALLSVHADPQAALMAVDRKRVPAAATSDRSSVRPAAADSAFSGRAAQAAAATRGSEATGLKTSL